MPVPTLIVLYVESPAASAAFYAELLSQAPEEESPGFAMFRLPSGIRLGLWARGGVEPPAEGLGGTELVFMVEDVDRVHAAWRRRGMPIVLPPTDLVFGRCCVALDPDAYWLRGLAPR